MLTFALSDRELNVEVNQLVRSQVKGQGTAIVLVEGSDTVRIVDSDDAFSLILVKSYLNILLDLIPDKFPTATSLNGEEDLGFRCDYQSEHWMCLIENSSLLFTRRDLLVVLHDVLNSEDHVCSKRPTQSDCKSCREIGDLIVQIVALLS